MIFLLIMKHLTITITSIIMMDILIMKEAISTKASALVWNSVNYSPQLMETGMQVSSQKLQQYKPIILMVLNTETAMKKTTIPTDTMIIIPPMVA